MAQIRRGNHFNACVFIISLAVLCEFIDGKLIVTYSNGHDDVWRPIKRQNGVCHGHAVGDFVSNPENCGLFYFCLEREQSILAACPPSMLFNPKNKLCDRPANVQCESGNSIATNSPSPGTATTVAMNPDDGGATANIDVVAEEIAEATHYCVATPTNQASHRIIYIGSSIDCRRYYICYHGQAVLQECSLNLHWNAEVGKCDVPEYAGCKVQSEHHGPGQNGVISQKPSDNNNAAIPDGTNSLWNSDYAIKCPNYGKHLYPHVGRCDFFIFCIKGQATLQQCPFYHHFDVVSKSCKIRSSSLCVRDATMSI